MSDMLRLKKSNCKNCYKCIRYCPVKAIKFSDGQAHIIGNQCILCGECFVVCPQNAKLIRNDTDIVKNLVASEAPVYVSLAPSFVANYDTNLASMTKMLLSMGFAGVEETAIGATMVKTEYECMIREKRQEVIISSCCHSVNLLIRKYHPGALKYLAHVATPMFSHCRDLKRRHSGCKTVFIGPCISKKDEADQEAYNGVVDCVLTFEELSNWMNEEGICLEKIDEEKDDHTRTRFFPTSGGILKTMECNDEEYTYLVVDGTDNCINALKDIEEGNLKNCFIEMSACSGSCINGPVMDKNHKSPITDYQKIAAYAGKSDFDCEIPTSAEMKMEYNYLGTNKQMPSQAMINEILKKMSKNKPEDELNCGSCGYNSCREKAIAVYQGKAELNMCLPFMKEKAESFSDNIIKNTPNGIIVLNEQLEIQQINKAAIKILCNKKVTDLIGEPIIRILEPIEFMNVLETGRNVRDNRIYIKDRDIYVEETIIYDKNYRILMCIIRDVTAEEKERKQKEEISRRTIEITDRVVEKQMRTVQEIASLLGETTAETKIAITKLKESLENE